MPKFMTRSLERPSVRQTALHKACQWTPSDYMLREADRQVMQVWK